MCQRCVAKRDHHQVAFQRARSSVVRSEIGSIRDAGGNPFKDYQLPEAVIKFRQGFGRLIRTATDRGMVVVLDPRIKTKFYGKTFLQSLPSLPVRTVSRPINTN